MAIVHADDFGITVDQAQHILALSDACGGHGALNSVSIFANSPVFGEVAELARPFVENGRLALALHLNLVEGRPTSRPSDVPLLVNERGTFSCDFAKILLLSAGPHRSALRAQVERECSEQIERFLAAFPSERHHLRIDSHQHVHAIPLVFDALLAAAQKSGCTIARLRLPAEPLGPHRVCGTLHRISPANHVKVLLLDTLCRRDRAHVPAHCDTPLFCGVALSGAMSLADARLLSAFEAEATRRAQTRSTGDTQAPDEHAHSAEMLFHPVSVRPEDCLDPDNEPFTHACSSPERDEEARALVKLADKLGGAQRA